MRVLTSFGEVGKTHCCVPTDWGAFLETPSVATYRSYGTGG